MSNSEGQDKSLEATPEKLKKARQKGNVAVSPDFNVLMSYIGFWLAISAIGAPAMVLAHQMAGAFWSAESFAGAVRSGTYTDGGLGRTPMWVLVSAIGPAGAMVLVGLVLQNAIVFAPTKLKPDLKRIDPLQGAKKKFGPAGLADFGKSAMKMVAVSIGGGLYLLGRIDVYGATMGEGIESIGPLMRREVLNIMGIGIGIAALSALIDVPLKRAEHAKRLRMSRQEVTDENKELEGDPAQKQARKKRAEALSQNKMLLDTAKASVVMVNPTHYAVALVWDPETDTAPTCVAKGIDHFALAIIERARLSGVPVREDPPAARALHATVEVGSPIAPEHFMAVAAAIRFADSVRRA